MIENVEREKWEKTPNTLSEVQCGLIVFVVTVCINSPNTRVFYLDMYPSELIVNPHTPQTNAYEKLRSNGDIHWQTRTTGKQEHLLTIITRR